MKLTTEIRIDKMPFKLDFSSKIMVLGSCFADNVGQKMAEAGFNVFINPFGTLYNPVSIMHAVKRLSSGRPFVEQDCVEMGAGAGKICSFEHHTSFARTTAQEFLENANRLLAEASSAWKECDTVIITYGTAMVWEHNEAGIVGNCLKRLEKEFRHYMLNLGQCYDIICEMVESNPSKHFIFTVSPIRHLSLGAQNNTLSKATLHLAVNSVLEDIQNQHQCCYFPAYEIVMDELRDYRFYAEDLVHPSKLAIDIVWQKFQSSFFSKA